MMRATKLVFVIGSPRSGASILTWSLAQHPHIAPRPWNSWIGKLAVTLGSICDLATGEEPHSQALNMTGAEFYETFGATINNIVLRRANRLGDEGNNTEIELREVSSRWIDGSPGFSFDVYGLLQLFPKARFIHVLRDVGSVVKS